MTDKRLSGFMGELESRSQKKTERGSYSLYKVHKVVSWLMVFITVLGLVFIVENQIHTIDLPLYEIDGDEYNLIYIIGLVITGVAGFWISSTLEDGKIESIAGFINSQKRQKLWFFVATNAIIILLVATNSYGVSAGADFFSRYLNSKVMQDDKIVLATTTNDRKSNMISSWQKQISSLERDKERLESARASSLAKYPEAKWRYKTTQINKDYDKKSAMINKAIEKYNYKIDKKEEGMGKIDEGVQSIIDSKRAQNDAIVAQGKEIGLPIAVWGEVIDAIFAFLYLLIYKSDEKKPSAKKTAVAHSKRPGKREQKKEEYSWQKKAIKISDAEIAEVIDHLGYKNGKHPSQRKIISAFESMTQKSLRPARVVEYYKKLDKRGDVQKRGKFWYEVEYA